MDAMDKAPRGLRLGAALCCSVLLHALVLGVRIPLSPPRSGEPHDAPFWIPSRPPVGRSCRSRFAPKKGTSAAARPADAPRAAAQREQSELKGAAGPAPPRPGVSVSLGPPSEPGRSRSPRSATLPILRRGSAGTRGTWRVQGRIPAGPAPQRRGAVVVLQLMIDEKGRVVEALPVPGAPEDFAQAALRAVKRTRFQPGEAQGKPVRSGPTSR